MTGIKIPQRRLRYRLVYAFDPDDLVLSVSRMLNEGWGPAGGVCVVVDQNAAGRDVHYWQAVTRWEATADA